MTSVNILMTFSIQTSPLHFSLCNARCSGQVVCPSSKGELGDLCLETFYALSLYVQPWSRGGEKPARALLGTQPRTGVDFPLNGH